VIGVAILQILTWLHVVHAHMRPSVPFKAPNFALLVLHYASQAPSNVRLVLPPPIGSVYLVILEHFRLYRELGFAQIALLVSTRMLVECLPA